MDISCLFISLIIIINLIVCFVITKNNFDFSNNNLYIILLLLFNLDNCIYSASSVIRTSIIWILVYPDTKTEKLN